MNNFEISVENLNVKRVYKTRKQFLRKTSLKIAVMNIPQSIVTGEKVGLKNLTLTSPLVTALKFTF